MPAVFNRCVKNGGEMFTVKIGKNKYVHGCRPKGSKKATYGEIKTKKAEQSNNQMMINHGKT